MVLWTVISLRRDQTSLFPTDLFRLPVLYFHVIDRWVPGLVFLSRNQDQLIIKNHNDEKVDQKATDPGEGRRTSPPVIIKKGESRKSLEKSR
jgi:hypothetical protein